MRLIPAFLKASPAIHRPGTGFSAATRRKSLRKPSSYADAEFLHYNFAGFTRCYGRSYSVGDSRSTLGRLRNSLPESILCLLFPTDKLLGYTRSTPQDFTYHAADE